MDNKELCYMLDNQVERLVQKGDITPNELDSIYKAVKTKYYLTVIKAMKDHEYDDYGYSGKRMMISYDGHPYHEEWDSYGRDRMGRYTSRDEGPHDDMRHHLEMALNAAKTESERQTIRNMMSNM